MQVYDIGMSNRKTLRIRAEGAGDAIDAALAEYPGHQVTGIQLVRTETPQPVPADAETADDDDDGDE